MSSLNVVGSEAQMTSEEGVRLEELLAQERQAREKLSKEFMALRKDLDDLKGRFTQGKPADHSAALLSEKNTATTAPPKSNDHAGQDGDGGLHDVFRTEASAQTPAKLVSARDAAAVRPARLDAGGMYTPEQSVWDAAAFIGHDSVGTGVSAVLALLWALNIAMQVAFCVLVFLYMQDADITTDTLDELLNWRVTVAHNINYADTVMHRSMIADMCEENAQAQLHMSATQASWHETIESFTQGGAGMVLMYLAQTLWICTVLRELASACSFGSALFYLNRGHKTRIVVTESDDASFNLEKNEVSRMSRTPSGCMESLLTLMVVVRVKSITTERYWACLIMIAFFRFAMGVTIGIAGILYLSKTNVKEDLVLNAIALEFIMGIDELLFAVFAPRRMQTLMLNLEALPLPDKVFSRAPGCLAMAKVVVVVAVLLCVQFTLLGPFFNTLEQADDILCGGELNFVWTLNPATQMVHVARTASASEAWDLVHLHVLQVAQPNLEVDEGTWTPMEYEAGDAMEYATSSVTRAVLEAQAGASVISDADYDTTYFETVLQLSRSTLETTAATLTCQDMANGQSAEASMEYLQALLGNDSITNCEDVAWQLCGEYDLADLRAICPVRCECDMPGRYRSAYAGFFQTSAGGCPSQCDVLKAARNEILHGAAAVEQSLVTYHGFFACEDLPQDEFSFNASCVDLDQFGPYYNSNEKNCLALDASVECTGNDDSDFTAADMCCKCGGGLTKTLTSTDCVDNLLEECRNMDLPSFWFLLYVRGLFQYLTSMTDFKNRVHEVLSQTSLDLFTNMDTSTEEELKEWIVNGSMAKSMVDGNWELMPGYAHPRSRTGCEYLASFEIKALLGIDLCAPESFMSIRFICPQTCGCTEATYKIDPQSASQYEEVTDLMIFTYDKALLTECPAACVLPHPDISGSTAFQNYDQSSAMSGSQGGSQ
jgi:hypothetical protein